VEPSNKTAPVERADAGRLEDRPDLSTDDKAVITELVRTARAQGVALTGPDGLLKYLTKTILCAWGIRTREGAHYSQATIGLRVMRGPLAGRQPAKDGGLRQQDAANPAATASSWHRSVG